MQVNPFKSVETICGYPKRTVILCENDTSAVEETWLLHASPQRSRPAVPPVAALADHERALIETALAECRGRISGPSGAAARLGIPRQALESTIINLGISRMACSEEKQKGEVIVKSDTDRSTTSRFRLCFGLHCMPFGLELFSLTRGAGQSVCKG